MAPWSNRTREWDPPVECEVEAVPEDDAHVLGAAPRIDGTDGQRARRSARTADAAVPGAGVPVVPGGSDHERVQAQGTGRSACGRAVDEGGKWLADSDERDPGGVMRAAVPVGVDRTLEPGDQLVGAAEEAPGAARVLLPPGDPYRQEAGTRRNSCELGRALGAGHDARQLGAVALEA